MITNHHQRHRRTDGQTTCDRTDVACSSVRPSVTLVMICDHIGWKSWKLIARTISPTPSLCAQPKGDPPTSRGTWGNYGETRGIGWENGIVENKSGNISETRKDGGKVTMGAYRNSPTLFPDPLCPPPFIQIGGLQFSCGLVCLS